MIVIVNLYVRLRYVMLYVEVSERVRQQYVDNIDWMRQAHGHNVVSIPLSFIIGIITAVA